MHRFNFLSKNIYNNDIESEVECVNEYMMSKNSLLGWTM